ncbi:Hemolymph lipopolysaccharide-binding protein [Gryllus bimaculatus]|nr:Hemolymph lipopolysaccharide-binding protein [Gryllus bimaculatus]
MRRHEAWRWVLGALLCVAVCGASDPTARPRILSSITRPQNLSCKAAEGVDFEFFTQLLHGPKHVLKILIKDDYDVTLLPPDPTPPPTPPTQPPSPPTTPFISLPPSLPPVKTTIASRTTPRPITTTLRTAAKPSITTGIPMVPSSARSTYVFEESDDDWDYIQGLVPPSNGDPGLLAYERLRHQIRTLMQESERAKKAMELFCAEAAKEDNTVIESDGSLHPSYEEVPGVGVYRLHARPRSWEEARKACEREGAQLAVPNSRTEALALMDIHNRCPRLLPTHFNDYQYLGVHDLYSEGDWETVVGYPLNETGYVNWAKNQPDNTHQHGENCLSMNRNGFFNDVPCWTELPFICEHP